jgi:hypothetical protein
MGKVFSARYDATDGEFLQRVMAIQVKRAPVLLRIPNSHLTVSSIPAQTGSVG